MSGDGDLVFVGDVHLEPRDPVLPDFLAFLGRLGDTASRVVFMGDLFVVWLGDPDLEGEHQARVLARLAELRRRGVVLRYLEGNRDFRIARGAAGRVLDEVTDRGLEERFGGRRLFAIHGDRTNPSDHLYRGWRALARSAPVWWLFASMPRRTRSRLAARAERKLRTMNQTFKGGFPERAVRAYAARWLDAGHDAVVLGHFHVERELLVPGTDPPRRIFVVPEWKGTRRCLHVSPAGEIAFRGSME